VNGGDLLIEALGTSIAALAIVCMYRICIELAKKNGNSGG